MDLEAATNGRSERMKPSATRATERRARLTAALGAPVERARSLSDVRAVYVYGSYAAGRVGPHSDLDVPVVRDTCEARHRRYDSGALLRH